MIWGRLFTADRRGGQEGGGWPDGGRWRGGLARRGASPRSRVAGQRRVGPEGAESLGEEDVRGRSHRREEEIIGPA
jgi:hypothetical protein